LFLAEETLAAQIKRYGITHLQCTPSQASMFLLEPEIESALGSLQKLLLGGEALPISLVKRLSEIVAGEIHNMYGPTETTVWSTTHKMEQSANAVSLGHPIANTQVYILDNHLQLLPVGVPGELFIGGKGVARGYLNQPALTAARFVPHPFNDLPGERLYRTGDLARYRSDGTIEYLGRLDQQVKLRGFRIELGEIEAVLRQHPNVQEGVVVLREEEQDRKYLVAYVVVRPEEFSTLGTSPEATVQGFLRTQLPHYMVPMRVVFLQALPLTPNSKVDRKALPVPDCSRLPSNTEIARGASPLVAPQTPLQEQLAMIWAELLHLPQIGIHHNFFELGGHSLLAVQLLNRMNKQFGVSLSLPVLSQVLTIEQAAALLEKVTRPEGPPIGATHTSSCVLIQPASLPPTLDHRPQEKPPFFCVHPSIGDVHCFLDLAKHLRHDRPFYGIQAPGLNTDQALFYSIEEIAATYIDAVLAIQPEDPYFLGGYSFGGLVAFEMAQQLREQGRSVAFLALLDSYPREPAPSASAETWIRENYAPSIVKIVESLGYYWNKKISISHDDLCHLQPDEQLAYILDRLKGIQIVPDDTGISQLRRYMQVHEAHDFCFRKYQPKPYPGRITLLRSEGAEENPVVWNSFSSAPVEVHSVLGDHNSMVTEPYVQSLAQQLQQCLDKAERE
jgi:thioesterase domain-containing protein